MKTALLRTTAFLLALVITITGSSQNYPELVFSNPTLIHGQAGQNGAKYRFPNVIGGANALDAIVEIKGRSSNAVVLNTIDKSSEGWNKAFQPELGINGSIPANANWWMEFRMEFVEHGTNKKKKIDKFVITSLDVDGDGNTVREWVEMKKVKSVQTSTTNLLVTNLLNTIIDILDFNNNGSDAQIVGPITNFSSIDTGATAVMATYEYENKDKIEFKLGGKKSNSNASAAGMRMNSLWFKSFSLAPQNSTLPVKLVDFTAALNNSKVELNWRTEWEENSSHFSIERSVDGREYKSVGIVFTAGNTNQSQKYSFKDDVSSLNVNAIYYRLRSIDIDGKNELSEVRIIRITTDAAKMTVTTFPNPVTSDLRVTIPSEWQGKEVRFSFYTQSGVEIKSVRKSNSSQTESIQVNDLLKGMYILRASCGTEMAQQKVLKN